MVLVVRCGGGAWWWWLIGVVCGLVWFLVLVRSDIGGAAERGRGSIGVGSGVGCCCFWCC